MSTWDDIGFGHDPARPDITSQRAVLATARAILTGADPGAAHEAAGTATCTVCTVVCALQLGFTLAAAVTGQDFVSGDLLDRLVALVDATERELDVFPN